MKLRWWAFLLVGSVVLLSGTVVYAIVTDQTSLDAPRHPVARTPQRRSNLMTRDDLRLLKVKNVRLEPTPPPLGSSLPGTVLKFDIVNTASTGVDDLTFEVSLLKKADEVTPIAPQRVIAGPYVIHMKVVLESDYSVSYELRLRDISSDCKCVANVDVLSARTLEAGAMP